MPNIYKEMLLFRAGVSLNIHSFVHWADMDITHNTASYQTILYEPNVR